MVHGNVHPGKHAHDAHDLLPGPEVEYLAELPDTQDMRLSCFRVNVLCGNATEHGAIELELADQWIRVDRSDGVASTRSGVELRDPHEADWPAAGQRHGNLAGEEEGGSPARAVDSQSRRGRRG